MKREMTPAERDKRWWHAKALERPNDPITQAKARELYPSLFWRDGGLLPADMVRFDVDDRTKQGWRRADPERVRAVLHPKQEAAE